MWPRKTCARVEVLCRGPAGTDAQMDRPVGSGKVHDRTIAWQPVSVASLPMLDTRGAGSEAGEFVAELAHEVCRRAPP